MKVPVGDTRTRIVLPNENIVTDGLVLYLDAGKAESFGGDGTTWRDLSGENNNGTIFSNVGFDADYGGSLDFNGNSGDYVLVRNINYPYLYTDSYTINAWVNIPTGVNWYNGGSGTAIVGGGSYGGSFGLVRTPTEGRIASYVRLNSGVAGPQGPAFEITRDQWYYLTATWDGSLKSVGLYVNGSFINQEVIGANTNFGTPTTGLSIGGGVSYGGSYGYMGAGRIPRVELYNRALSAAEVLQNYNATKYRYEN
jgi:hypothetical protein